MLSTFTRAEVLRLKGLGLGIRKIAGALRISRKSVRRILASGSREVPKIERRVRLDDYLDEVRDLHETCKGNVVRVHEELENKGIKVAYPTLTHFCRSHGIGVKPPKVAGEYQFEPGEEMQFDTSPHEVKVDGRVRLLQCASLVLCFSRMIFMQYYIAFNRFTARLFLTQAFLFLAALARRCMVDNGSVIVIRGTGANAVMAAEMEAFSERFNFMFAAHERGDANRSARVERPFDYIQNNFLAGRVFRNVKDVCAQAKEWCIRENGLFKRHLHASHLELFQIERPALVPLPEYVPEPYAIHPRGVDTQGYVNLHTNRYSVPDALVGCPVTVRETAEKVFILRGHDLIAEHDIIEHGAGERSTLPEHRSRDRRGHRKADAPPTPQEQELRAAGPEFAELMDAIRRTHGGRCHSRINQLHKMYRDIPTDRLTKAIAQALHYGLVDVHRIERIALKMTAGSFFNVSTEMENQDE